MAETLARSLWRTHSDACSYLDFSIKLYAVPATATKIESSHWAGRPRLGYDQQQQSRRFPTGVSARSIAHFEGSHTTENTKALTESAQLCDWGHLRCRVHNYHTVDCGQLCHAILLRRDANAADYGVVAMCCWIVTFICIEWIWKCFSTPLLPGGDLPGTDSSRGHCDGRSGAAKNDELIGFQAC